MKYTETHEWIELQEDGIGVVGITSYAQKELGEIVYVELPKIGSHVKQWQEAVILESTKAAADIYSPVSGEVVAINDKLKESVYLLNEKSEDEGWLYKVRLQNKEEYNDLMDEKEYLELIS